MFFPTLRLFMSSPCTHRPLLLCCLPCSRLSCPLPALIFAANRYIMEYLVRRLFAAKEF